MNEALSKFARAKIKEGLSQLPESWQVKFKLMYGSSRTQLEKRISVDINTVVDEMSDSKLDWALSQVEASVKKLEKGIINE